MGRQEGGSYPKKCHCDGIKHGGEKAVSSFLDKIDLIAVETVKTDGEMERQVGGSFPKKLHRDKIKNGGEISYLRWKDLIAVERVRPMERQEGRSYPRNLTVTE